MVWTQFHDMHLVIVTRWKDYFEWRLFWSDRTQDNGPRFDMFPPGSEWPAEWHAGAT